MSDQLAVHRCGCPAAEGPLGKLIELVVQRLTLAHDVAAVKYANGQPIDDRAREREILQDVAGAWKPDLTRRPEYSSSRSDRGQQGNSRNLNP